MYIKPLSRTICAMLRNLLAATARTPTLPLLLSLTTG